MRLLCCLATIALLLPCAAFADTAYPFSLDPGPKDKVQHIVAVNRGVAPVDVYINLTKTENTTLSRKEWPVHRVIAPGASVEISTVQSTDGVGKFSYTTEIKALIGDPISHPDPKVLYRLPFENEDAFTVLRGPDNALHAQPDTRYAIDIAMPAGTPVVAARAGYIVLSSHTRDTGNLSSVQMDKLNLVEVYHPDDGSSTLYAHLNEFANLLSGTFVQAYATLGTVGADRTGASYLHFAVVHNEKGTITSVPFTFTNRERGNFTPTPGMRLAADYNGPRAPTFVSAPATPDALRTPGPFSAPFSTGTTPAKSAGGGKITPRPAAVCMQNRKAVDEAVVACMTGEGPVPQ